MAEIVTGDVLDWAASYEGEPFHAMLCDPPYGLEFMSVAWDTFKEPKGNGRTLNEWGDFGSKEHPREARQAARVYRNKALAYQQWIGECFSALAEHLLPGAFLMAFGGSRTYHRLACAVEDAGLVVHPAIVYLTGQGFPKATRIDTQIDKAGGSPQAWRDFAVAYDKAVKESAFTHSDIDRHLGIKSSSCYWVRTDERGGLPPRHHWKKVRDLLGLDGRLEKLYDEAEREVLTTVEKPPGWYTQGDEYDITAPATPLAATWAGHRYGLQALKPAAEFILVAQKPYQGKPVESITTTGAGALNIDGARVACNDKAEFPAGVVSDTEAVYGGGNGRYADRPRPADGNPSGRWPSNVLLQHVSPDADGNGGCRRVGTRRVRGDKRDGSITNTPARSWKNSSIRGIAHQGHADADGRETVEAWECEAGCPVAELGEQSGERPVSGSAKNGRPATRGGYSKDWHIFNGGIGEQQGPLYNDQGTAARFFFQADFSLDVAERLAGVAPFWYAAKSSRRERDAGLEGFERKANDFQRETSGLNQDRPNREGRKPATAPRNHHPTVKPLSLCKYLAGLLLPPAAYAPRRILVPFAGSGSEMVGAVLAGWEDVLGIEQSPEYVDIARARLAYWAAQVVQAEMQF